MECPAGMFKKKKKGESSYVKSANIRHIIKRGE